MQAETHANSIFNKIIILIRMRIQTYKSTQIHISNRFHFKYNKVLILKNLKIIYQMDQMVISLNKKVFLIF